MIKVIQYGLGPIGSGLARLVATKSQLQLVGGVDIDPTKIGKDLGDVIGLGHQLGVTVKGSLAEVLKETQADAVLHTTSSYFDWFKAQLIEIAAAKLNVVSTAEELSFPWGKNDADALEIHNAFVANGVTALGTGINPGFLMDSLPLFLTSLSQKVERVEINRVINASTRRGPFQKKIGCGMTVEQFNSEMAKGRMGHVGLPESMRMLFNTLGRNLVRYEDSVEPVVATRKTVSDHYTIPKGKVKGLYQVANGYDENNNFITLTFRAELDAKPDGDFIQIFGVPNLQIHLKGTNGDIGTAAIAVNALKRVVEAPAGLVTMRDLPIVHCL